jgi:protein-tyrosine-phosphatase
MADLGTVLTVVDLVQRGIVIYQRIESLPQQMKQLGRRMERLNIFLVRLKAFVEKNAKNKNTSSSLLSGQVSDLDALLKGIEANAAKVHDLFERYEKGTLSRSRDLEFRARWMSQIWFSLVDSSPDKVKEIMEEIDYERSVLSDYLSLMAVDKGPAPSAPAKPRAGRAVEKQPATALTAVAKRASPSPSPAPPRRDYRILFVDPYNEGRSVVAEGLVKLLAQLTLRARGDWRIAEVRSAGFFAKDQNECVDVIDGLKYSHETFKLPWWPGGKSPSRVAMAGLFDNKWCNHPFKEEIRTEIAARKSRGMKKDVFSYYDFIVVFALREHDNMVKLKEALRKKTGAGPPRGKGRVLQLGSYLSPRKGAVREILHPAATNDAKLNREKWNAKVAEIKTALKEFLKQEMKWEQPNDKGPAASNQSLEVRA